MKVLMLGNSSKVHGGISSVIKQIRDYQWGNDIEITFIATYDNGSQIYKALFFLKSLVCIVLDLFKNKPDVIYMHMSHHGSCVRKMVIHKLCKIFHVSDVIHLHGSEFKTWFYSCNSFLQNQIKQMMRECGAFIVLGNEWQQIIKEIEPEANTFVLPNSVHCGCTFSLWNEQLTTFLFMGVLVKRKGIYDLLEAVNLLKHQGHLRNKRFIIAGSGEEAERLHKRIITYDLNDSIILSGWVDESQKENLFKESQVLILPSYNEGLPMAILEAMSFGMPIIATRVGDVDSAVANGVNGVLIEPGNVEALVDAINSINDKSIYDYMSQNSKHIVKSKFSDDVYFSNLKRILYIAIQGR